MMELFIENKLWILIAVGAGLFLWEYFLDFRERQESRAGHVSRNLIYSLINSLVLGVIYTGALVYAHSISIFSLEEFLRGIGLHVVVSFAIFFFLFDFLLYFWHRANHTWPFLWRFHKVHHTDKDLDFSSAVRFHFGELFLSLCVKVVLVFLTGLSPFIIALFDVIVTLFAMFNHSNISLGKAESATRKLIVTPSMHRVHHSEIQEETDSNYCTTLSLWDYLFKTFRFRSDQKQISIGLTQYKVILKMKDLFVLPFR